MIAAAAGMLLQLLPAPAEAAGWQRVAEQDPEGEMWIDPASIRDGAIAHPVYYLRLYEPRPNGVQAVVARMRIDCRARTAGFQTVDTYGPGGVHLGSRGVAENEVQMAPIGNVSAEAILLPIACGTAEAGR